MCEEPEFSVPCAGGNVPIFFKLEVGNASDKKLNNTLLTEFSRKPADAGIEPAGSIYTADSALMTGDNLRSIGDSNGSTERGPRNLHGSKRPSISASLKFMRLSPGFKRKAIVSTASSSR
jgi:hypothetical protein